MNRSRKTSLALVLLVIGLLMALGAGPAFASPQGDEDLTFNGQGAAFNTVGEGMNPFTHPLTTQDPNNLTVIAATAIRGDGDSIHIARFTTGGKKVATYGGDGDVDINTSTVVQDLLDVRVLPTGEIYVLFRNGERTLGWVRSNRDGSVTHNGAAITPPVGCEQPFIDAARVEPDGNFASLWNCQEQTDNQQDVQAQIVPANTIWVVRSKPDAIPGTGNTQLADKQVIALQDGTDLELDPLNGDVYVLGSQGMGGSYVVRLTGSALTLDPDYGGAANPARNVSDDDPVDLAVDYSNRPLVWTRGGLRAFVAANPWVIHRLKAGGAAGEGEPDPSWDNTGVVALTDDQLGDPFDSDLPMLLARPGDKVMAIGANASRDSELIVRMNTDGTVDTSWADHGYKQLGFINGDEKFILFGNIALQGDNKTLVAFHSQTGVDTGSLSTRSFGDPGEDNILGVGRLDRSSSSSKPSNPSTPDQGGVAGTSAKGSVCGRRAISLVRAFSRGGKVELQGLVGAAYYGKKVKLYASSGHGFRKVKTTKATRTGTFKAKVRRPRGRRFVKIRYIAKAGRSRSPVLKLPQSLKSTSIKQRSGKIIVKGRVKRALVGSRRNRVKIQRLVCGHYKTVGSARPTRGGKYVVTFDTPVLGGVAYFRARGVVLNKPHGRYVVQYARAIRIKLTDQTG